MQVIYSIKELSAWTISTPCSVLVDKLILAIKDWDKYARPTINSDKGSSHSDSMRLTASIEMTASLYNNTYIETDTAIKSHKVEKRYSPNYRVSEVVDEDIKFLNK